MTLSEKLYNLRRKQGLSQETLAEKLNCSRQVISKWENGTTSPDAEMLQKYSELFGVSIDYLVKEDIEEPTNPITTPDLVDVKPDDIASSGVSKDTDDEDDTSKKTKQEQKDDDDTVTVPEKDIPNSDVSASPKTGDNSGNVLFIFGRMICALGVFIFVLKRRKVTK